MQTCIDFRKFEPRARHALFFALFEGLKEDESFRFINDHDPVPLQQQLRAMNIGNLCWKYEVQGPDEWQIRVSKKIDDPIEAEEYCAVSDGAEKRGG